MSENWNKDSDAHQKSSKWKWENATAGAVAGFATVAAVHPLDVVRTRFQVNDGHVSNLPTYKNTANAILTIARLEGLRGLYAGFNLAVIGSTVSWGLYFFFYSRAKERYSKNRNDKLNPGLHLVSAAEAGALVCLCTNPIWLVKTRLQLQTSLHPTRRYSGLYDAFRTIMREEGWRTLYKGIVPGLFLVSHGAIQFTIYEEFRKVIVEYKSRDRRNNCEGSNTNLLNSADYAVLGGASKIAAIMLTYPFQVIRARLQERPVFHTTYGPAIAVYGSSTYLNLFPIAEAQRPIMDGIPRYMDSWHVVKETLRFEGLRGLYKGITPNILKNVPAASITFVVYENVLKLLKLAEKDC